VNVTGLSLGTHNLSAKVFDVPNWVYTSALLNISVANTATVYRNKANTDISVTTNWGLNADGSGANPTNFTTNNQYFRIANTGAFLASAFTLSGANTLLKIDTGYSLTIRPTGVFNIGTSAVADFQGQSVLLQSTGAGTGSIGNIIGTLNNATNVTQQRFINARRAPRFLGHPFVNGIPLTQLTDSIDITGNNGIAGLGFTPTATNNPSAFWFNTLTGSGGATDVGWLPFTDLTQTNGNNGWNRYKGINVLIRGVRGDGLFGQTYTPTNVTLAVRGGINTGTQTIPLTYNASSTNWNLISNPYPSAVSLQTPLANAGIASGVYVWNAQASTRGAYQAVPVSSNYVLPSGSAFMIQSTASAQSITFNETDKSTATALTVFGQKDVIELELKQDSLLFDKLFVFDDANATDKKDKTDLEKLINSNGNLYTLAADGSGLSIDHRNIGNNSIIPLTVNAATDGDYTISFSNVQLSNKQLYLHDKLLNSYTVVQSGGDYTFHISTADNNSFVNRFELTAKQASLATIPADNTLAMAVGNTATEWVINYQLPKQQNAVINVIGFDGKLVNTVNLIHTQQGVYHISKQNLVPQLFIIELQTNEGKLIVKVNK